MTRDLRMDATATTVVLSWRSVEGGLLLRVRGETEDVRPTCRCGRCHWIAHEVDSQTGADLLLICHHCGRRWALPMEKVPAAAR